jgi:DtxR family Mn-dependent transcriptional regulator
MCHKLHHDGLAEYVPYKGVTITADGAQLASRILRRHRLWEVFLVEHLQMGLQEAHGSACQLEHATSDEVIERLARFLSHPQVNPEGDPIPDAAGESRVTETRALADMDIGQCGEYVQCDAGETCRAFLAAQGLRPGTPFQIVATAADSLLLESNGRTIALSVPLASAVRVAGAPTATRATGAVPRSE